MIFTKTDRKVRRDLMDLLIKLQVTKRNYKNTLPFIIEPLDAIMTQVTFDIDKIKLWPKIK